jgi:hypothetical protein
MEPEVSLTCSQEPVTGSNPEPGQSNPYNCFPVAYVDPNNPSKAQRELS